MDLGLAGGLPFPIEVGIQILLRLLRFPASLRPSRRLVDPTRTYMHVEAVVGGGGADRI